MFDPTSIIIVLAAWYMLRIFHSLMTNQTVIDVVLGESEVARILLPQAPPQQPTAPPSSPRTDQNRDTIFEPCEHTVNNAWASVTGMPCMQCVRMRFRVRVPDMSN